MTLVAIGTTEVFIPAGDWTSAAGVLAAKAWGELSGLNGNCQARPAVQLANDTRSPDGALGIGAVKTANGVVDPATLSLTTGNKAWIRPGWVVSLSSGQALASVSVIGTIVFES